MKILVFGAHPDDVELAVGGIVAKHAALGYHVEICDLTAGEMGSNGTPQQRLAEGRQAAQILGAAARHNLGLPDAFLEPNREALLRVAQLVRQVAPEIVLAPWRRDSHPDHEAASTIVTRACYLAGLHKLPVSGSRHRPRRLFYYFLAKAEQPTLLVDIDDWWQVKLAAIAAHASQFAPRQAGACPTYLNREDFLSTFALRFQAWGRQIGCQHAEALVSPDLLRVGDITKV